MLPRASPRADRQHDESSRGTLPDPGVLLALLLFACLAVAALSLDVVRTTYGIKGDEATYVAMALSAAHDGDFAFERRDLIRFWSVYQGGPEGIFLKRGHGPIVTVDGRWPFLHLARARAARQDRLYFGKAFIYPLVAAPFIRLAGLNGLLLLQVLLLAGVFVSAYLFALERAPRPGALLVSVGFLVASVAPLYAVWLTPEIFNLSVVCYAYFLWLYKEVRDASGTRIERWLLAPSTDLGAAALLGLATFSKPSNLLLILPLVALAWSRRRWRQGLLVGVTFVTVVAGCFAVNAIISGEFNYQGGDRKTFYGHFPFERGQADFETLGISVSTNTIAPDPSVRAFWTQLAHNVLYVVVGRHFGLLAYYFPGLVVIGWALWRWKSLAVWHGLIAAAVGSTLLGLVILLPNTWSGGGGPPGNRYFLSVYPALFFLVPRTRAWAPGLIMWAGIAFTGTILVDPFVTAKRPWQITQQGLFRALPVELTMVNDLPVRLDQSHARIPYGRDASLLLYFLDDHASRPGASGILVNGRARADIIVRTSGELLALGVTVTSPVANTVTVSAGGPARTVQVGPRAPASFTLPVRSVYAQGGYSFVMSVRTTDGFVPHLWNLTSRDRRFLGAAMKLAAIPRRSVALP